MAMPHMEESPAQKRSRLLFKVRTAYARMIFSYSVLVATVALAFIAGVMFGRQPVAGTSCAIVALVFVLVFFWGHFVRNHRRIAYRKEELLKFDQSRPT